MGVNIWISEKSHSNRIKIIEGVFILERKWLNLFWKMMIWIV